MKFNKFNKLLGGLSLLTALLMMSAGAQAAVKDTKHNLGTGGSFNKVDGTGVTTTEICVFCHTPHGADNGAAVPLWNKTLGTPGDYTSYATLNTTTLDGATAPVGSVSIACLSCHDGTQAMDSTLNAPGSGNTALTSAWTSSANPTGMANLAEDLSNDHPIGIQYGGGGITEGGSAGTQTGSLNDSAFRVPEMTTANGQTVWWVDSEASPDNTRQKTDMQLYTRSVAGIDSAKNQPFVECASCHDPHTSTPLFLRTANTGSAVCLACHVK